ncbi:GIY-YIG nuclease family protein [Thalassospiraceae bacterium LMO-JJ14]|nr:GIY-YIG nuclease family protein [Thalassospiraceae bacterium LMO-JJ14]
MNRQGYLYILASRRNGTLYIGVTSDLVRRVWEHRAGVVDGFSKRYGCKTLVYFETFDDIANAIQREKALKEWKRAWKLRLIEEMNPTWRDLWDDICRP